MKEYRKSPAHTADGMMARSRRLLFIGTSALSLFTVPAQAQSNAGDGEEGGAIIVTATKRAESLQNIAQSVTAFSEENLTQFNVQSFGDYATKVPNLTFNAGSTAGQGSFSSSRSVTIRGVAGVNTTSLYIDDTPIPVSQDPRIVDVERIEVLKGPQGTLYGSAAIGGTLRIITKQPSLTENELKYMVQGGVTKHGGSPNFGANAIGNIVLVPGKVGMRVMGFINHDAGYITRTYPLSSAGGATSSERGKQTDVGAGLQYGGSVALRAEASDALTVSLKLLGQREEYNNGPALVYRGDPGFDPTSLTVDREYDVPEYARNGWFLPALTLNYEQDNWSITSSTSYYQRKSEDSEDVSEAMHQFVGDILGYDDFGGVRGGATIRDKQFQQEIRLSAQPIDNLDILAGAYYLHSDTHLQTAKRTIEGFSASAVGQAFGATQDIYYYQDSTTKQDQKALFGEISYKAFDLVTITAGLRRFWIDQDININRIGFIIGANSMISVPARFKNRGYSPKFSVKVEPTRDTTLYGSAAKGFRPGGAGSSVPSQCLSDLASLGISAADLEAGYKPDSVWSYEVGAKQSIANRRVLLSGAMFQTDWKNIQQTVSLRCGTSFTGNAGAARIRGFEGELTGNISRDLTLRMGFGYTDAKITDDAGGSTNQTVGSRLYDVPKWTASAGGYYTHELSDDLEGFVSADWQYSGSSYSANNSTSSPAKRGAYSLVNARFGVRRGSDELSLYINNLFNKMANYGDHVPDISSNFTLTTGESVPHSRVSIATPFTLGVQFRHGF